MDYRFIEYVNSGPGRVRHFKTFDFAAAARGRSVYACGTIERLERGKRDSWVSAESDIDLEPYSCLYKVSAGPLFAFPPPPK